MEHRELTGKSVRCVLRRLTMLERTFPASISFVITWVELYNTIVRQPRIQAPSINPTSNLAGTRGID